MKQKLIAVFAVLALFAGLIAISTLQASAHEGEEHAVTAKPMEDKKVADFLMKVGDAVNKKVGEQGEPGPSFGIKPSGEVMLQGGKVTAVSGASLTVTVMGFSVPMTMDASLTTGVSAVALAAGDTVGVQGKIDAATGVITATMVRKHADQRAIEALKLQIQQLMEQLRKMMGAKIQ